MAAAFTTEMTVVDVVYRAVDQFGREVEGLLRDPYFHDWSDEELADHFAARWTLEPIEWDSSRRSELEAEEGIVAASRPAGSPPPPPILVLHLPIVPKMSNPRVLTLRPEAGWTGHLIPPQAASYDDRTSIVQLRSTRDDDLQRWRSTVQTIIKGVNADIARHMPGLRQTILEMVRGQRAKLDRRQEELDAAARSLGVTLRRRPEAVEPVNVRVRRAVDVVRNLPRRPGDPADPHLTRESLERIIALVDQAGKGFELAPREFAKLREEGLRHVIVGYLNAVFESTAVTGETFSKDGRPDLVIQVGGGPVLMGECKFWDGPGLYRDTIDHQLFRYVTWRQTAGLFVTFSRGRSLTAVVEAARATAQAHPGRQGEIAVRADTSFVSSHVHPDDPLKTLEIHHLIFNLYAPRRDGAAVARRTDNGKGQVEPQAGP